jgi:cardiolipin synthase
VSAVLASLEHDLAALIVVAVSSISDWADGYIARRFNQVSELGKSLDPIADRCFILVTFVVLVVREEIPIWLLLLVVGRDLVMAILVSLVARSGHRPMAVTYVGKAATLCLLVAMPLFLLATLTADASTFSDVARVLAWIFALIGVVLYWASAIQYLRRGVTLLRVRPEVDNV